MGILPVLWDGHLARPVHCRFCDRLPTQISERAIKLLMNRENQAVILPKEFQIQGAEIYLKKIGNVIVLIIQENPRIALFDSLSLFSLQRSKAERPIQMAVGVP